MIHRHCPACGYSRVWKIRRYKFKCKRCRREFSSHRYPIPGFHVTEQAWKQAIAVFLRERTIRRVKEESGLSHGTAERIAMHLRLAMASVIPPPFHGPVEMDETYIGGQRKNKRLHIRRIQAKKGHGTDKLPIVAIFDRPSGAVFVVVEPRKLDMAFILSTVQERVEPGARVYTDGFKMYRQLRHHGFDHNYVDHDSGEYVRGDIHTNNIEGFWGILKRKLGCIGGMQRKYLYLFVAEIVWRFNHRAFSLQQQEQELWELIIGGRS